MEISCRKRAPSPDGDYTPEKRCDEITDDDGHFEGSDLFFPTWSFGNALLHE
jgi:hypothetical protein